MKSFSELGITSTRQTFSGEKIEISNVLNIEIIINQFKIEPSKYPEKSNGKRLDISINHEGKERVIWTGSVILQEMIQQVNKEDFPFKTKIIKENKGYKFT